MSHRQLRRPATALPDDIVAQIVIAVVARHGHLDAEAAVELLRAELARRRGRRGHLWLVESPWAGLRENCPSGVA